MGIPREGGGCWSVLGHKLDSLLQSGSVEPSPIPSDSHPATKIMIDTYMAALGFEKTVEEGRFRNSQYEVGDVVPRNVLVDDEGDVFVVDAEIKHIG